MAATPDNLYVLDDLDTKLSAGNRPLSQTEFNVIVIYFYCVSFVSNGSMSCLPRSWTMYPTPDDGRCRIQTLPVPQKQTLPSVLLLPPGHVLQIYAEADGKFLRGPPHRPRMLPTSMKLRAKEFQANLGGTSWRQVSVFWLARQM